MDGDLVYGVLDASANAGRPVLTDRCRDWTITWSRYDYHGPIIEHPTIEGILDEALSQGFRYCFIQRYGQVVSERWSPEPGGADSFLAALREWAADHDVLASGRVLSDGEGWHGLDPGCLLVDVQRYGDSKPSGFGRSQAETQHQLPVVALPEALQQQVLDLEPHMEGPAEALAGVVESGIDPMPAEVRLGLTGDQRTFLDAVSRQAAHARHGVFLVNIEGYADIDAPPPDFEGPVSRLYSVAAGFKPNRILQTHGMADDTEVVFFDYSETALAIRKTLLEEWDGSDFPRFVRYLTRRFPPSSTFYQLWGGEAPDADAWARLDLLWMAEAERLGGEEAFKRHWTDYRTRLHHYIHCDLLGEPESLLDMLRPDQRAVMWFSNAPFTVYGNWRYTLDHRTRRYETLVRRMAELNPHLWLYGSDCNNGNVNWVTAGNYWSQFHDAPHGPLERSGVFEHEIRM